MRGVIYLFSIFMVVVAAYWSYSVTYKTQDKLEVAEKLRREIGRERQAIAVLQADWAYLNAPERLEKLVADNSSRLGLKPMIPERFAELYEIDPPQPDDGMEPVAIIGLDELAPRLGSAPAPTPRPVGIRHR